MWVRKVPCFPVICYNLDNYSSYYCRSAAGRKFNAMLVVCIRACLDRCVTERAFSSSSVKRIGEDYAGFAKFQGKVTFPFKSL